jgi:hypothetical protein
MAPEQADSRQVALIRARTNAVTRLVTMTGLAAEDCRETFLFEDDRFCGVRWTLGDAKAVWRSAADEIKYQHGDQQITLQQAELSATTRRAA